VQRELVVQPQRQQGANLGQENPRSDARFCPQTRPSSIRYGGSEKADASAKCPDNARVEKRTVANAGLGVAHRGTPFGQELAIAAIPPAGPALCRCRCDTDTSQSVAEDRDRRRGASNLTSDEILASALRRPERFGNLASRGLLAVILPCPARHGPPVRGGGRTLSLTEAHQTFGQQITDTTFPDGRSGRPHSTK
jgi:hypothetical protein